MLKEHASVVLTQDLPASGLAAGDVGIVVHVHRNGETYEVEFLSLDGATVAGGNPVRATGARCRPARHPARAAGAGRVKPQRTISSSFAASVAVGCASPLSPFDTTAASIRSPVTLSVVRHMSKTVDAEDQADAFRRHPDHAADQRDHRQRTGRHAGGADAAEDAHEHHRHLLRQRQVHAEELGENSTVTPSNSAVPFWLAVAPTVSTKRERSSAGAAFPRPRAANRQRGVARCGGERHHHRFLHAAEELARRPSAEELQHQRIHHERVDGERQHHHADVGAERAQRSQPNSAARLNMKQNTAYGASQMTN